MRFTGNFIIELLKHRHKEDFELCQFFFGLCYCLYLYKMPNSNHLLTCSLNQFSYHFQEHSTRGTAEERVSTLSVISELTTSGVLAQFATFWLKSSKAAHKDGTSYNRSETVPISGIIINFAPEHPPFR